MIDSSVICAAAVAFSTMNDAALQARYGRNGFVSPVGILSPADAAAHRARLEQTEVQIGSVHYRDKAHVAMPSAAELATHPAVLDAVEACIGPNIVLLNSTYIIKEPGSAALVSWHQDLTYWNVSDSDAQVSMWLALSPATEASGCMTMVPGSHRYGAREHRTTRDPDNVLLMGQHLRADPTGGQLCPLAPGEASFHHGWTVHSSAPNASDDRRIGLNVQYLAPHARFDSGDQTTAVLVRGKDAHGNFAADSLAHGSDIVSPAALEHWLALDRIMKSGFSTDQS